MHRLGIDLFNISYKNMNEVIVTINEKDYELLISNKTIYEVEVLSYKGLIKIKKVVLSYKYILIFIIFSFLIIYMLSNLIFKVDIITNDKVMKNKISKFLQSKGIYKYHIKKDYNDLKKIKEDILNKYKDEIDWIEIEPIGSKYIVRYEPRLKTEVNKDNNYQDIVSTRNALIYSMDIKRGQILKNRFDYVKKGDVIVSGYIYLNEKIMDTIKAEGVVLGETWYTVSINYPYKYKSVRKTGNNKNNLSVKFINRDYLLCFNRYKDYKKKSKVLLKNNILPISIDLEKQLQLDIKKEHNTYKEAVNKGVDSALKKINKKLKDDEYIKDYKILSTDKKEKSVSIKLFVSVIEQISEYRKIDEYKDSIQP